MSDAEQRAHNVRLVERYLEVIGNLELDGLPAILHEDADLTLPYPPPGIPAVVSGRQAFCDWMDAMPAVLTPLNFKASRIDTLASDPDELVAEYTGDASLVASGKPYRNVYIARIRVQDGLIREWKEWFNPLVFLEAFGDVEIPA